MLAGVVVVARRASLAGQSTTCRHSPIREVVEIQAAYVVGNVTDAQCPDSQQDWAYHTAIEHWILELAKDNMLEKRACIFASVELTQPLT